MATELLLLSLSRLSIQGTMLFHVEEPVRRRKESSTEKCFQNIMKLTTITSSCTNLHSELGHPFSFLYQVVQNHSQQLRWSLHSPSEQPVSVFDQPFCKNFVYNCLTWISAVAASLHCVMSLCCLSVTFKPLCPLDLHFQRCSLFPWNNLPKDLF